MICTSILPSNPTCASDKVQWVTEMIGPEWVDRLILARDKTVVAGDYLIDDKPHIVGKFPRQWRQVIFQQPYNIGVPGLRALDWADLLAQVQGIGRLS